MQRCLSLALGALLLAALPTTVHSQISCGVFNDASCRICGPGKCVTNPDAIVTNAQGVDEPPCGELENLGRQGFLSNTECTDLSDILLSESSADCGCQPETAAPGPTPAQVVECGVFPDKGCRVCGPNKCVSRRDAPFTIDGKPESTCGELEEAGRLDQITATLCFQLTQLTQDECGCVPATNPVVTPGPTPSPTPGKSPKPTPQPVIAEDCLDYPDTPCRICGPGKCVTKPNAIFTIPGQPQFQCGSLEAQGRLGLISDFDCSFFPSWAGEPCGCEAPPAPTRSPADPPAFSPVLNIPTFHTPEPNPFDGLNESEPIEDDDLTAGAVFGIVMGAVIVALVVGLVVYKGMQEHNMRSTHQRGTSLDPTSTPTKAPPQSLFMASPDGVDGGSDAAKSSSLNFAAGEDTGDPQDGAKAAAENDEAEII